MLKGAVIFVPFNCEIIVGEAAAAADVPNVAVPMHLQKIVEEL
jgi:hypothetical protein